MKKIYYIIAAYWLLNGLVNIPNSLGYSKTLWSVQPLNIIYTLINIPFVLLIFLYSFSGFARRFTLIALIAVVIFELSLMFNGKLQSADSLNLITAAGFVLVFGLSITGIMQYLQRMEHEPEETAMVFVYAALLFAYGGFIIVYIFQHLTDYISDSNDSFLLYYISLFLAALITCLGLWSHARPVKYVTN